MMKLTGLIVAGAMALAVAARADTVGLRSGDHPGFTRIVIQFADHEDWVFGRVDGGFELRPAREDISYRLDRVYDKISRARIAEVQDLGDGRLFLAADCDCHGTVDELSNGQVVVDIVSGPARDPGTGADTRLPPFIAAGEADIDDATSGTPAVSPQGGSSGEPGHVRDRAGLPLTLPRIAQPVLTLDRRPIVRPDPPDMVEVRDASVPEGEDRPSEAAPSEPSAVPDPDQVEREARIARTETELLEQIARATAQGLLDADMSEVERSVAEATPQTVVESPPPEIERPMSPVLPRGHIAVQTGVDRAAAGRSSQTDETAQGDACIDPSLFEISGWGRPITDGADIGAYRSHLVGEFDVADGNGVTALARHYIYITFGAEAKALMRQYPDSVERPDLLFAMAEIVDEGWSAAAPDLVDQMGCAGATALWATLAQPALRPGQMVNLDAVTLTFGALPAHLRRHLGPGLAEKLLEAGHRDAGDVIRGAVARAGSPPNSAYGLLSAQFEMAAGEVDVAVDTLDEVVAAGDAMLPEALLRSVDATLDSGGAVPDDIITLLDGLAFQLRGTETAAQMIDAGIRARASASQIAAAFEQLETAASSGAIMPGRDVLLREMLFEHLTRDADDTRFLQLALPRLDTVAGMPAPIRQALAARLLDLGFGDLARSALGRDEVMPQAADRILLARAALMERRPAVAIGYLAGLTDAAASGLRAEALVLAQDYDGAMRAYGDAGDEAGLLDAAWRGGRWSDVVQHDQGAIGAAARLMSESPQPFDAAVAASATDAISPEPGGIAAATGLTRSEAGAPEEARPPLAAAQVLIAESQAARETLGALLDSVPAPQAVPETDLGE